MVSSAPISSSVRPVAGPVSAPLFVHERERRSVEAVLVPSAASAGEPPYAVTSRAGARRRIDALIDRVRAGGQT